MAGAPCNKTGEVVQPIGRDPRARSCQRWSRRCWLYWRLSPSLMVNETKTLDAMVGVIGLSDIWCAIDTVGCTLVHTSKSVKKSEASTSFAVSEVNATPLASSINQPRSAVPGGQPRKMSG